ncbi:hypothetical protein [Fuerstiella marisgermanici]|uniref:Anti-sigma-28 factor FlgM C-terminal domain-containing protein n=1 Tax=Fuerstiella marisgermanici TaxID=1891926 RepID=A0A1P8W9V8_9PLAN|nr:hypothetical protein [Fuerstiella marisgermanici]APZ90842.1 hypothetical protein Fuma_00426 [Fuerstiella marisgermanici]
MRTSSDRSKLAESMLHTMPERETDDPSEDDAAGKNLEADGLSEEEVQALRQEKLKTIRAAIDAGVYDSDDLLEKAMNRMREAIKDENDTA